MKPYQREFIQFCLHHNVLRFGEFTLKSGRISPYFFNAGLFNTGEALAKLGQFYAQAIIDAHIKFDTLFGPAYKGIPLVSSVAIALSEKFKQDFPYCFNRKEAKDHGEGGVIVGAPLAGRVLIIDDVITAGTAVRHSVQLIEQAGAKLAGIAIALDRQERGQANISAIQEIEKNYSAGVTCIITLKNLLDYLAQDQKMQSVLEKMADYWNQYGVINDNR